METVTGGGGALASPLSTFVVSSWRRCLNDYKLDLSSNRRMEFVSPQELKSAADGLDLLQHVARPEIASLLSALSVANYSVVLSDANGVLLDVSAADAIDSGVRRAGVSPGAMWQEAMAGTNGVGTAIAAKAAVTIHREEHYFSGYAGLTCTAAPILDWKGETMAAIDASALIDLPEDFRSYVLEAVKRAARRIEQKFFIACHRQRPIMRIKRRLGEADDDGLLIALADDGTALEILRAASDDLHDFANRKAIGLPIGDIMDVVWQDAAPDRSDARVSERIGIARMKGVAGPWFASLREPMGRPVQSRSPDAPRSARPTGQDAGSLTLETLAGGDTSLKSQLKNLHRLVDRRLPVLLHGETGTGKEEFARAIHGACALGGGPFVAIDCSSIPESLIESELFGYETGTFTGGRREGRRGRIAQANGGTLFLDEIGDMPLALQTRLLRVLAQREVVPLGGGKPVKLDFNLVCASHQNFETLIAAGRFRQDLYFRIAGVRIEIPALRHRDDKERVIALALSIEAEDAKLSAVPAISGSALDVLLAYRWTGNIRELRMALRFALAHMDGDEIEPDDLPDWLPRSIEDRFVEAKAEGVPPSSVELEAVLAQTDWCVSDAAAALRVSRQTLYRWMKLHALHRPPKVSKGLPVS
ncbi:sigma-54-dependent Fis family transcriptional regulator [Methylobacterium sp. J-068]|uniref:sigma-54-dependent Fis family transcriptional regulator n=1 Tax=Methylobacterium sp. J-068 TaxID=2836649 RepID=UPI001FBB96E1|nr:sigma-54-dependent Fis family transcriptional regulator [Methylobacterium sp. J-068]MCJ2033965.1 sigma-54-dependent Fis family transcriptional regulator [Methylobacterium sp. J-068]